VSARKAKVKVCEYNRARERKRRKCEREGKHTRVCRGRWRRGSANVGVRM
jgi:hypothetical protein